MKSKKKIIIALFIASLFVLTMCKPKSNKQEDGSTQNLVPKAQTEVKADTVKADTTRLTYVCPPCGCNNHNKVYHAPGTCSACGMAFVLKK